MNIDKNQILGLLRSQGDDRKAQQADQELPDQVDTDRDAGLLSTFGIDPMDLVKRLGGGGGWGACSDDAGLTAAAGRPGGLRRAGGPRVCEPRFHGVVQAGRREPERLPHVRSRDPDLKSLAQEAALAAMTRSGTEDPSPVIEHRDFVEALERHRAGSAARALA